MKDIPFSLYKRKTVCENSVFKVCLDHLTKDNKSIVKDYLVVKPKYKNINGFSGVAVLPVKDNKYGLINVYRHATGEYGWEVPRGFIDVGEEPEIAALRELQEETGIISSKQELEYLGDLSPEPGVIAAKVCLYKAMIMTDKKCKIEHEPGHIAFEWFGYTELKELIHKHLMSDATSLTTCLMAL